MRKLRTIEMNRLSVEEFHQAEKTPLIVMWAAYFVRLMLSDWKLFICVALLVVRLTTRFTRLLLVLRIAWNGAILRLRWRL